MKVLVILGIMSTIVGPIKTDSSLMPVPLFKYLCLYVFALMFFSWDEFSFILGNNTGPLDTHIISKYSH